MSGFAVPWTRRIAEWLPLVLRKRSLLLCPLHALTLPSLLLSTQLRAPDILAFKPTATRFPMIEPGFAQGMQSVLQLTLPWPPMLALQLPALGHSTFTTPIPRSLHQRQLMNTRRDHVGQGLVEIYPQGILPVRPTQQHEWVWENKLSHQHAPLRSITSAKLTQSIIHHTWHIHPPAHAFSELHRSGLNNLIPDGETSHGKETTTANTGDAE